MNYTLTQQPCSCVFLFPKIISTDNCSSFPPASLSQEQEAQDQAEPQSSGPSENEVALQEALNTLQQEKDTLTAQYQAQVYITLIRA